VLSGYSLDTAAGALEARDAGAPGQVRSSGLFRESQAQLAQPLRNAEGKFRVHTIFRKQALRASHADRIKRERCVCGARRSVPAINGLPA